MPSKGANRCVCGRNLDYPKHVTKMVLWYVVAEG
jgi:hypothetical protein